MFTGIITELGKLTSYSSGRLLVEAKYQELTIGESIAVNGVCLTVVETDPNLAFDLSVETLKLSTLGKLDTGSVLNLERALRLGDRLGGHIVQGHVDSTARIGSIEVCQGSTVFEFLCDPKWDRYVVPKGSVSIDGISLTIVNPSPGRFECWIIPHTLEQTNLRFAKSGDNVNVEFDMLAKHVAHLVAPYGISQTQSA